MYLHLYGYVTALYVLHNNVHPSEYKCHTQILKKKESNIQTTQRIFNRICQMVHKNIKLQSNHTDEIKTLLHRYTPTHTNPHEHRFGLTLRTGTEAPMNETSGQCHIHNSKLHICC